VVVAVLVVAAEHLWTLVGLRWVTMEGEVLQVANKARDTMLYLYVLMMRGMTQSFRI
jgi:hypothetical protein